MNSKQYEELCRFFLAEKLGINIEKILSVDLPNPKRPGLPEYKHQIDLYWEVSDDLALYLNIANAKWRGTEKVDQPNVLLLQKVKEKVGAHKCVMITNSEFTAGARAAAQDDGVALHIVRPAFDYSALEKRDPVIIRERIQQLSTITTSPLYSHEVVFKAFDFMAIRELQAAKPNESVIYTPPAIGGSPHKIVEGFTSKAIAPQETKQQGGFIQKGGANWPTKFEKK